MAEADEYVDGTDVNWVRLARSIVGGLMLASILGFVEVLETILSAPATGVVLLFRWFGEVIELVLGIPSTPLDTVAESATETLGWFGVVAWPLSGALIALGLWLGWQVLTNE